VPAVTALATGAGRVSARLDGLHARAGAMSAAASALDAELERAPVDEYFTLILRACARGGRVALDAFCRAVEDPSKDLDEAPALALVAVLAERDAADRAIRAAAWAMAAQRIAETWPDTFYEVLEIARVAMPLSDHAFERMQMLGALTACASTTDEADTRDGQRSQFSRESLEHVIAAATGGRPARRDLLLVIPPWTGCFIRGIRACDEHLRELAALHPDLVPR
jgi:hypothetical protein